MNLGDPRLTGRLAQLLFLLIHFRNVELFVRCPPRPGPLAAANPRIWRRCGRFSVCFHASNNLSLFRVALDELRQNRNVVIAQIDEARLVQPHALLVFGLRIRDACSMRQAAVLEFDDNDEEVAFANLFQADVDRPSRPGPKNSIALCRCWTRLMASRTASRSCSRSSKVLQTNTVNDADIGFPHDPSNAIDGASLRDSPDASIAVIAIPGSSPKGSDPAGEAMPRRLLNRGGRRR